MTNQKLKKAIARLTALTGPGEISVDSSSHGAAFLAEFYARRPASDPKISTGPRGSASFRWKLGTHGQMRLDVDDDGGYCFFIYDWDDSVRHGRGPKADHRIANRIARLTEGNSFACVECTCDVSEIGEYDYMVHDEVWKLAELGETDGMLCVGCLEERIGRRLQADDFTDAPVNQFADSHSVRLESRLSTRSEAAPAETGERRYDAPQARPVRRPH